MTVSSTTDRKLYTGDDATVAFATSPVVFFDETDLEVYIITIATGASAQQTLTTDYTVSGGAGSTGTVTMLTAPASTEKLLIKRVVPATQPSDFVNNDASDAEVVEDALDRLTMIAQQKNADSDYPIRLSDAETPTDALTHLPFDRASKFLAFNASKELVASDGSDGTEGALAVALAASTGSSIVGFAPSGIGARTDRTAEGKLQDWLQAADYDGDDFGEKVAAAIAAGSSSGCTVDAKSLTGAQSAAANPFAGVTKPVHLLLPASTITIAASWIPEGKVTIEGFGEERSQANSNPAHTTIIKKGDSLAAPAIRLLNVNGCRGSTLKSFLVDGNKAGGATGDGIHVNAQFVTARGLTVQLCENDGIVWGTGDGGGTANHSTFGTIENVTCGYNDRHGFYIKGDQASGFDMPNASNVLNCVSHSNGGDGYRLDDSTNVAFTNSGAESNDGYGLHIMGNAARWHVFGGDYNEGNTAGNVRIESGAYSIIGGQMLGLDADSSAPFISDASGSTANIFLHGTGMWGGVTGNTGPRGRYEFGVSNNAPLALASAPANTSKFFTISDGGGTGLVMGLDATTYGAYIQGRLLNTTGAYPFTVQPLGGDFIVGGAALAMRDGSGDNVPIHSYGDRASSTNYQRLAIKSAKTTLSAVSGATVTATSLIPDGAFLIGVTTRVNTALGATNGTTGYAVGTAADPNLWGDVATITEGTVSQSADFTNVAASGLYIAAESVLLTAAGGNFDGTGAIEVCAHYINTEAD